MADTTFAQQIATFATRVGTECKALHTKIGDLTGLNTDDKTSVVNAIKEVKSAAGTLQSALNKLTERVTAAEGTANTNKGEVATLKGQVGTLQTNVSALQSSLSDLEGQIASATNINDEQASATTTYSSNKINSEITAAKQAVKSELLGGAGEAYDTLKELADLIQTNGSAIEALEALAVGHVKFDGVQSLTDEQKTQARTNISAAAASDLTALQGTVSTVQQTASTANSEVAALKAAVGDTTTDFVAAFEAALNA